ncbi:uncharacterized protein PB2B2.11 [Agrilus planipennis]|uniref:Uncharacterized protein PB2B2.11 n=1 Tax=Agrilus planipennis TaxID=224129 RepID=A0A7F5R8V9_AGRPL|nr:uncharacterized protein PB2B2.11 [Agrilus planipennis]
MEKRTALILGGCGFIGRNLLDFLITNNLVQFVRIVDKVPPQVAWLNSRHQELFNNPIVEFKSANLINNESCKNAFASSTQVDCWDYVINCAGETKLGHTDPVYKEGILKLSINCASQAALKQVKCYVEISSGQMMSSEKTPHKEDSQTQPWTMIAAWKKKAEDEIKNIENLNYVILRPAIVYGIGDKTGLTPRILGAAIYKQLGETMKLLWNADLGFNTLHVEDLCRAIWFVCQNSNSVGQVFNVVDDSNSNQGSISDLLIDLFHINVGYYGNMLSSVVDIAAAADEANDKHLGPWAEACRADGIENTPLSPHMDPELLLNKHLRLDGSKLKNFGFQLKWPKLTCEKIKEIIDDYIDMKIFPHCLRP